MVGDRVSNQSASQTLLLQESRCQPFLSRPKSLSPSTGNSDLVSSPWPSSLSPQLSSDTQVPRPLTPLERKRQGSPVLLNCRVHMHFPSRVHCSQSAAPHAASEQFPAQKTSRWLIRQSFSEVQDPLRPMQAPSGQLVHHLQRGMDAW